MKKQTLKTTLLCFLAVLLVAVSVLAFLPNKDVRAVTYSPWCTSQACRAAADKEAAAQAQANEASKTAQTLAGKVAALSSQIASIQAEIDANEVLAKDIQAKIVNTEQELEVQQEALASLVIKRHLEGDPETIMILAESESLSDYAEKQSRQDAAEEQINSSATKVKEAKEKLDQQKIGVEAIIREQHNKRQDISDKRNEQSTLMAKYKYKADSYASDAEAARRVKAEEINKAIRASIQASGAGAIVSGVGGNSYPYQKRCPAANLSFLAYGGYVCQCTSYAGWKVYENYGISISAWGNASNWGNSARSRGYRVDSNPAPGTVAYTTAGYYGHVMWVESVNGNTITLSEYNYVYGDFSRRTGVPAGNYRYIHFN